MSKTVLVRYGAISEVSRFVNASGTELDRGANVVVQSHRGIECGLLLEDSPAERNESPDGESEPEPADRTQILRESTDEDRRTGELLRLDCENQYSQWQKRIQDWKLRLELIDLEWTLDKSKLILYVLNDRGPESTRLALQAAAAGLGVIEVQPVGADGLVPLQRGSGCGSGGCGSGGGSSGCCH
jgi:cell fate regulator YaaT (PSP1 superfamily)